MKIYSNYVQVPSQAPGVSTAQGTGAYRVAHRRVNKAGYVTANSPVALDRTFPMTITPQTYGDSEGLLRDEFLISNDAGINWRLAQKPEEASEVGPITLSAWSANWPLATIGDTQVANLELDAGQFDPSAPPSFTIYLATSSASFSSLHLKLWNAITGKEANEFTNLLRLTHNGLLVTGTGALTNPSGSIIWAGATALTSGLPLQSFPNQVHKLTLNFLSYPSSLPALNLALDFATDQRIYKLSLADEWPDKSLWINPDKGFNWPIATQGSNIGKILIKRLAVAYNGQILINPGDLNFNVINGDYKIIITPNGQISLTSEDSLDLVLAVVKVVNGQLIAIYPACAIRGQRLTANPGTNLKANRFVTFSNEKLVNGNQNLIGISVDQQGNCINQGYAIIEAAEAISIGAQINAHADGRAINGQGPAIALSASSEAGQFILVYWLIQPSKNAETLNNKDSEWHLNRLNHKGEQSIESITGLQDALNSKIPAGSIVGLPAGGSKGQYFTKNSDNNFDANWQTPVKYMTILVESPETKNLTILAGIQAVIQSVNFTTDTGDATFSLSINETPIAGLTALVANSTLQSASPTNSTNLNSSQKLRLNMVASPAVNLLVTIYYI